MNKKFLVVLAAVGLMLTACEPSREENSLKSTPIASEALNGMLTFYQTNKAGEPQEDGNYIHFEVHDPAVTVQFYNYDKDGKQTLLATGVKGMFVIAPPRGGNPVQSVFVRTANLDGSIATAEVTFTVFVATELAPEVKLIASNSGSKKWKWSPTTANGGAVWGNGGYLAGPQDGSENINGAWWGCGVEDGDCGDKFSSQLQHSAVGAITGEEYSGSYMEFFEDGTLTKFDADGKQIGSGTFSISDYSPEAPVIESGAVGYLNTSAGAILWPYAINMGGFKPERFEIAYLSVDRMVLQYAAEGTGAWSESTWWSFASDDDAEGFLTSGKWGWRVTSVNGGAVWGNGGYLAGAQDGSENINGAWWGCGPEDGDCGDKFSSQLQHSAAGAITGEEYLTSYMVFGEDGKVAKYDNNGNKLGEGTFELDMTPNDETFSVGTLKTSAGAILWPYAINLGGYQPEAFNIGYIGGKAIVLQYAADGTGGWGESTWWSFGKQ